MEEEKKVQEAGFLTRWLFVAAVAEITKKIVGEHQLSSQAINLVLSDRQRLKNELGKLLLQPEVGLQEETIEEAEDSRGLFLEELVSEQEIWLGETDGQERISEERKLFPGHIAEAFYREAFRQPEGKRNSTKVKLYGFSGATDLMAVFCRIGQYPRQLALSQGQVAGFCREHLSRYLRDGRQGVFFPAKLGKRYRLIYIRHSEAGLSVELLRLDREYAWLAQESNLLVIPADV